MSLLPDDIAAELRRGYLSEPPLVCLTFNHADLVGPIRLVNNNEDIVRGEHTFTAFPFTYRDYVRGDSDFPTGEITADNVDERIVTALRGLPSPPTVIYEAIIGSDVVQGPMEFLVLGFAAAVQTISLRISLDFNFLSDAFPKDVFSPSNRG